MDLPFLFESRKYPTSCIAGYAFFEEINRTLQQGFFRIDVPVAPCGEGEKR